MLDDTLHQWCLHPVALVTRTWQRPAEHRSTKINIQIAARATVMQCVGASCAHDRFMHTHKQGLFISGMYMLSRRCPLV
jgi:hypothetical protein